MEFEWDASKAKSNQAKHGVSFDEARTTFDDPKVKIDFDEAHSTDENRWVAFGISIRGRPLVVSHVYRAGVVRIVSARRATSSEVKHYAKE